MSIDSGAEAVCWICLEGGADETGKPIVRDCACRGNDAGFAHTSCIVKYAQKKCKEAVDITIFATPWEKCPTCQQDYQNELAIELAEAFVSFAEITYGYPGNFLGDKMKVMDALRVQIQSNRCYFARGGEDTKQLIEILIHKLLEMVDQAKEEHDMKGWVHMPPTSEEFQKYRLLCGSYETFGYICFGQLYLLDARKESKKMEISYYAKARDIYKSIGMEHQSNRLTVLIDRAISKYKGDDAGDLIGTKKMYNHSLEDCGENSDQTIMIGVSYASSLRLANCSIEAERLVTKLVANSHQVYGDDHPCSKISVRLLNHCKRRFIHILSPESGCNANRGPRSQALRYENDGKHCIVTGPIPGSSPFDDYDERPTFHVTSESVFPAIGCPVICHGLINAPHLNGKLGDVRSVSVNNGELRLGVHFEDNSLKSAAVKPGNLRIAFVLPTV